MNMIIVINWSRSLFLVANVTFFRCPIVSLYHVPPSATEFFQGRGGLLTGTLEGGSFWQDIGNQENEGVSLIANFKPTILPLAPGSCTGLNYCSKPQCFLATFRPGTLIFCLDSSKFLLVDFIGLALY